MLLLFEEEFLGDFGHGVELGAESFGLVDLLRLAGKYGLVADLLAFQVSMFPVVVHASELFRLCPRLRTLAGPYDILRGVGHLVELIERGFALAFLFCGGGFLSFPHGLPHGGVGVIIGFVDLLCILGSGI